MESFYPVLFSYLLFVIVVLYPWTKYNQEKTLKIELDAEICT